MSHALIGGALAVARRDAGLTQEALAHAAGISATTISRAERGLTVPRPAQMRALEDALETAAFTNGTQTVLERHADGTAALTLTECGSLRYMSDDNTTVRIDQDESVEEIAEQWREAAAESGTSDPDQDPR